MAQQPITSFNYENIGVNIDGGSGIDTLGLAGSGLALDLSSRTQAAKIAGVEAIVELTLD